MQFFGPKNAIFEKWNELCCMKKGHENEIFLKYQNFIYYMKIEKENWWILHSHDEKQHHCWICNNRKFAFVLPNLTSHNPSIKICWIWMSTNVVLVVKDIDIHQSSIDGWVCTMNCWAWKKIKMLPFLLTNDIQQPYCIWLSLDPLMVELA